MSKFDNILEADEFGKAIVQALELLEAEIVLYKDSLKQLQAKVEKLEEAKTEKAKDAKVFK